jgi:hypothetical protein
MLKALGNWLRARRIASAKAAYQRGFDYAAGELLRGVDPEAFELEVDARAMFDATQFDEGITAALAVWNQQHPHNIDLIWPPLA